MNIDLKKINWQAGKAASQPQLMTLRIRKKSDEDAENNYTTIADDLLVYTDGTILNPPVINDLESQTDYVLSFQNNDLSGGSFDLDITTPGTFQTEPLNKTYYPDSELSYTHSANFRDTMLPPKVGAYYSLEYTRADWFGIRDKAVLQGDWEWNKKNDLSGIKLKTEWSKVMINMDDAFKASLSTQYAFGVHFYVAAEDLPATGIWPLISFTSVPNGDGMQVYVNCSTKKVHWRQQKGTGNQEIVSVNTINMGAWNQVLVFRASDVTTSQMWLNSSNTFTGAFTAAGAPMLQFLPEGVSVGSSGGIFSKFYYTTVPIESSIAGKYQQPPYPVAILQDYYNPENKYNIPGKYIIAIENGRIICTLPPNVPTGRKQFYIQDSSGTSTPMEINILPLKKMLYPVELDFNPEGNGYDFMYVYHLMSKGWGGANGGVSSKHIYMQDDLLVLEAHGDHYEGRSQGFTEAGNPKYHDLPEDPSTPLPWNTRVGAVISSKDYYGYGRYVVEAKLPREMGIAPAFWVSHYSKVHPQDPRYEQLLARGLHSQGDQYNENSYVVEKNEIDMELPSHDTTTHFYSVAEMLSAINNQITWAGMRMGIMEDPNPENNGTWKLNNAAAPQQLGSWSKINNDIQYVFQPRKDNIRCNNWKGELGEGLGSSTEDEYLSMLTNIGKDVWDGQFHEFRFDWYANRVEFYVDGVMIQVNTHFVPDVPGRWNIGLWFPSPQDNDRPWHVNPYEAWAGPVADWKYQKMLIKRIAHTPFSDQEAGGTNRLVGETNPFTGLSTFPEPNPG